MEYHYDEQEDTLTINFGDADVAIVDDDPEHAGVIMEYTADEKLVNFKLLEASRKVKNPRVVQFQYRNNDPREDREPYEFDAWHKELQQLQQGFVVVVSWYSEHETGYALDVYFREAEFDGNYEGERFHVVWDKDPSGDVYSLEIIYTLRYIADPASVHFMKPCE